MIKKKIISSAIKTVGVVAFCLALCSADSKSLLFPLGMFMVSGLMYLVGRKVGSYEF